jgi:TetR/AcrR family tetracycline transcriptional repressor
MNEQIKKETLDKLERKRLLINKRLDTRRKRINERFDKKKAQLDGKLSPKQEQIIAAALEHLAEGGLNELSLRDIAKKLDIKAPALYWYFKSKSELIDYMAEAMLSLEFNGAKPRNDSEAWQDWLTVHMGKLRKAMLAYPDGGRVVAGAHMYPARTLAQIFEDSALSLTSAGMDPKDALYTAMTAVQFTFGFVIEEQSGPTPEELATITHIHRQEFATAYPNFVQAVEYYTLGADSHDRAYAAGLQLIIKGAEAK